MRVVMVGSGYVGLVSGAGFAETRNQVLCADIDPAKVDGLSDKVRRNRWSVYQTREVGFTYAGVGVRGS